MTKEQLEELLSFVEHVQEEYDMYQYSEDNDWANKMQSVINAEITKLCAA